VAWRDLSEGGRIGHLSSPPGRLVPYRSHRRSSDLSSHAMTQEAETQGLLSKAEMRLATLKEEKLVTRISVLSTLLAQGKVTERLMVGMSVETHKTSPDFDQKKCTQAKSRIMEALGDIGCDVFIEMDR
jgi:hypothetical protein